jgi:hypothetical protein
MTEETSRFGVHINTTAYVGTDELCVEFYACPACGFQRVPRVQDQSATPEDCDAATMTASFCPGCGSPITWGVPA